MHSPFVFVIFGATGDLSQNKLIPALFNLFKNKQLPDEFYIVGFARRDISDSDFHTMFMSKAVKTNEDTQEWSNFVTHISYQQGDFGDEKGYLQLVDKLQAFDDKIGACITRIFYLATPPENYETILNFLNTSKLSEGCGQGSSMWTRVAIEKPFGKDVVTAQMLDKKLAEIFNEKQIFRVDHYLGKETVQNMLVFRFANGLFEPVWNSEYIDHVQITFAEEKGIAKRGKFFDGVGILRDVAQNHLMQLLAGIIMDQPKSFSKEDVRDARAKAIGSIKCINPSEVVENVIRGQYKGYLSEKDVKTDSKTETYVATKFFLDKPRFLGVPFYIRAGKQMARNEVSVSLVFKQTCHILFKEIGCPEVGNVLTFKIQPNEGITLKMIAKMPGTKLALQEVDMHLSYAEAFNTQGRDAYEKILVDIIAGDQMLFNRSDELESSWQFITNILNGWEEMDVPVYTYDKATMGPKEADDLLQKDGRKWI